MNHKTFSFDSSDLIFDKTANSCSTDSRGSSCCSSKPAANNMKEHWNNIFSTNNDEELEWYEETATESLSLIEKCKLHPDAKILNVGAGTSTLLRSLHKLNYSNLHAADISQVALNNLKNKLAEENININTIEDDLSNSEILINHKNIDLWHDRAAFHFLTEADQVKSYFDLIKNCVRKDAYLILAPFNKKGTNKCSGLNVKQYDIEELNSNLGDDFELLDSFDHIYTSPKQNKKHFIYCLYRRIN